MDKQRRTLAKTITWRILAVLLTVLLVLILSKDLTLSLLVGGIDTVLKTLAYYFHERAWEQSKWGR